MLQSLKVSHEEFEMSENKVNLLMTGDIMLGGEFLTRKDRGDLSWEYPFKKVKSFFEKADIIFGNLECPLSNDGPARADKAMALYAPPDSVCALKYLNYNVISLANNHINDYGEEGLIKTIEILKGNKILFFGAGKNLEEASQGVTIKKRGLKVSFLGYTTSEEHVKSIIADADTAGCVFYDFKKIKKDIANVKNNSDIICISLHWGFEYYLYPSPEQIELAHKIIDAGAHIVIGHHPHVIQGFERYKHGVIFYSLGNFFFPNFYMKSGILHKWQEKNNKSIVAKCKISKKGVEEIEILCSFMNTDYQVDILNGKDKEEAIFEIEKISTEINREDYEYFWHLYTKERTKELTEALLKRMRELGVKECIKRISMGHIKHVTKMLVRYLSTKLH